MLVQNNRKNDDGQNDCKNQHEAATLVAGRFLVPRRLSELDLGAAGIVAHVFYVVRDRCELLTLFRHNLRHLSEQDVEITDTCFDIPNLLLTLDDERFLEVHLVLGR